MHEGTVVQVGTPVELFERPRHTFVGYFIGSPGMNVLPCELEGGRLTFAGRPVPMQRALAIHDGVQRLEIGIRPEFVSFADDGIPVEIVKVSDAGRYRIVDARHDDHSIKLLVSEGEDLPSENAHVRFDPPHMQVYADGWIVD